MNPSTARESIHNDSNPLGLNGIEFIETTTKPQALGQRLEMMGFAPDARHRSREILLYRQGGIDIIVNAHQVALPDGATLHDKPVIAAIALRVRDASSAYNRALACGAWAVPPRARLMKLNIAQP